MSNSIINLENLTEPLTKLVEVASKGMGALYAPFGTVYQAKADAQAKIIHAEADAEVLSLQQRAQHRLQYVESCRQANLERIVVEASQAIPNVVSGKDVNLDWILQFFENAQDVGDAEMQKLWGRLLAGEVAFPQSYSKRTLQFLKTMDKQEALAFVVFCGFVFKDSYGWHFVFDGKVTRKLMRESFHDSDFTSHFSDIGLITSDRTRFLSSLRDESVTYFGTEYNVTVPPKPPDGRFEYAYDHISLTQTGQELRQIVDAKPVPNYIEELLPYLKDEYKIELLSTLENARN